MAWRRTVMPKLGENFTGPTEPPPMYEPRYPRYNVPGRGGRSNNNGAMVPRVYHTGNRRVTMRHEEPHGRSRGGKYDHDDTERAPAPGSKMGMFHNAVSSTMADDYHRLPSSSKARIDQHLQAIFNSTKDEERDERRSPVRRLRDYRDINERDDGRTNHHHERERDDHRRHSSRGRDENHNRRNERDRGYGYDEECDYRHAAVLDRHKRSAREFDDEYQRDIHYRRTNYQDQRTDHHDRRSGHHYVRDENWRHSEHGRGDEIHKRKERDREPVRQEKHRPESADERQIRKYLKKCFPDAPNNRDTAPVQRHESENGVRNRKRPQIEEFYEDVVYEVVEDEQDLPPEPKSKRRHVEAEGVDDRQKTKMVLERHEITQSRKSPHETKHVDQAIDVANVVAGQWEFLRYPPPLGRPKYHLTDEKHPMIVDAPCRILSALPKLRLHDERKEVRYSQLATKILSRSIRNIDLIEPGAEAPRYENETMRASNKTSLRDELLSETTRLHTASGNSQRQDLHVEEEHFFSEQGDDHYEGTPHLQRAFNKSLLPETDPISDYLHYGEDYTEGEALSVDNIFAALMAAPLRTKRATSIDGGECFNGSFVSPDICTAQEATSPEGPALWNIG